MPSVDVPEADTDEMAAIVAALNTHLQASNGTDAVATDRWEAARWLLTGRIQSLQHRQVRFPATAPPDAWTAAGRTDRY